MKKFLKSTLAVFLVVVMVLGAAPLIGFIGLELPNIADFFNIKSEATSYSGMCGENLTWSYDQNIHTLTISGTGDMYDYTLSDRPWEYCYVKSVSIGNGVTSIGNSAFYDCDISGTVTIPKNVSDIGENAFRGNPIEYISVALDNRYYSSDSNGVLFNKDKTKLILYPIGNPRASFSVPYGVRIIGKYSFGDGWTSSNKLGNEVIETVTIPNTVTTIESYAFYSCQRLKNVSLSNSLTTIGESAFESCSSLSSILIPDSVTNVGDYAFANCDSLSSVTIGKGLTQSTAGYDLDFHLIFRDCCSIKEYKVSNNNPIYYSADGVVFFNNGDEKILVAYPHGRTNTFYEIPEGTTDIDFGVFEKFYWDDPSDLTSLKIPNTMEYFWYPMVDGLEYLQEVIVNESHPTLQSLDGVVFSKDKTRLCLYPRNKQQTSYVIPDGVKEVRVYAFKYASNLVDITISNSVNRIGEDAFYKCGYYNDIDNWQDGTLYIGSWLIAVEKGKKGSFVIKEGTRYNADNVFEYKSGITELTVPSTYIGNSFMEFNNLTNVETLHFNAVNFQGEIDYDLESLKTIYFGNTVEILDFQGFSDCKNLEKVEFLPTNNLKEVRLSVFCGCERIENIILPDSVEIVKPYFGCALSPTVHIPSNAKVGESWSCCLHYIEGGVCTFSPPNYCSDSIAFNFKDVPKNYKYNLEVCDGSHSIPCVGKVTGVDIHDSKIQLKEKTMLMEATVYPETAENKDIIWKSSNTEVADFYDNSAGILMGYKDGYTVITATTVEGGYTDSCIVFVGDSTITVSSLDGNYIPQNKTHEFNVTLVDINCLKLTEMGNVCICGTTEIASSNISFVIENNSVATIENITSFSDNIIKLKLKGIATGTTYLTIKNIKTGETKYIPIYVYDGENTFLADNVPQTNEGYEHRGILNFSHENIHVYDYEFTENSNCSVDVSFTAYNQNTNNGSVEIYDSEGNLKNSFMLEAHNGGNPTGVWENVKQMGEIIKTWGNLDIYDPTSGVWSTKTKIFATIPKDGYIKITNDITNSNICLMYNVFDIVIKSIDLGEKGIDLGEKAGKVTEKITKTVVEKISEIPEDTIKKFVSKFVEELTKSNSINDTGVLLSLVQDFVDIIKLDFEKIVLESIESVVAEKLTDIALDRLPVYGKVVKGLYAVNEFIQFYDLGEACYLSIGSGSAYIYVKQDENKKVSNGIVYEGYADTETVLRTYAITYGGVHDNLALDYGVEDIELYDISLVKDGDCIQPSQKVKVYIPIPSYWYGDKIKVYRVTVNGAQLEYEDMNAVIENGYMVFETDHFSYYTLINEFEMTVSISAPSTTTISYGDSIVLHADLTEALPTDWYIEWTSDNGNFTYSANGETCRIDPNKNGSTTFTATIYDAQGNAVSTDTQTMTSKAGFFDKIIAFFKKLFGLTKVIQQSLNTIY